MAITINEGTATEVYAKNCSGTEVQIVKLDVGSGTTFSDWGGSVSSSMNTLIAGEDQTNDVLKTEGQFSYYHHVGTAGSTLGTVKASAGLLHSVYFNTHTSGGTYALYDSLGTSSTVIAVVASGASIPAPMFPNAKFTTGLTILSGSVCDITFTYR